ncbi:unnamed protein product [Urochloa decumbens]|uniref:cAMP-regulated phosphoprotein 19-related protein n=2 Tax=Urochloa decumbens TaxID=240449 RepID=A0ABC9ERB3_9POAL
MRRIARQQHKSQLVSFPCIQIQCVIKVLPHLPKSNPRFLFSRFIYHCVFPLVVYLLRSPPWVGDSALCRGAGRSRMAESSATMGEEAFVEKKYGGMTPKKPLISKDQERAYFDSADWVLGKQAANSSGARAAAIESLKPKLKRTPHPQLPPRKPTCASS